MTHLGAMAAVAPDKPAVIMGQSGRIVSYRELNDQSNRFAQLLYAAGLRPGDHIAFMLENHPLLLAIAWAAQRSGLYYTAISSRLQTEEATYILDNCEAKVFVSSAALAEVAVSLLPHAPAVEHALMVDGTADGFTSYEAEVAKHRAQPLDHECEGADMLYSSGTTGRPKGVKPRLPLTPMGQPGPLFDMLSVMFAPNIDSVYLSPAPLYHAAPLRYCVSFLRFGATVVVMEKFDAEKALSLIDRYRVTHSQWVPTMFIRMLRLDPDVRARYDVSSLKYAVHAAAPCPIPVKEELIKWWGPIVYEYYAGTEGNGFCFVNSEDWLAHKGTVGRPILGVPHICDDDGNELPPGEPGTIYFSDGPMFEYHDDTEKTESTRDPKGRPWTTIGDVGYLDEDGFLYLTDRRSYTIISGGVNIYPQEIENLLAVHPKVADVAVFGVPHAEMGEEVKAVVQPTSMDDAGSELEAELIAYCRDRLAHFKCPRSVDFRTELPRQSTGKLYKRLLKAEYWPKESHVSA